MKQRTTLTRLAADLLLAHRGRRFTPRELAEALLAAHLGLFAAKRTAWEAENPGRSVGYQIEREIYARRHAIVAADPALEVDASDRMLLFAEAAPQDDGMAIPGTALPASLDPARILQDTEAAGEGGLAERTEADLYPVLQTFLLERESIVSKRIREQTSSNRRGRNGNKWLHPDIVGMHAPGREWLEVVRRCSRELPTRKSRLRWIALSLTLLPACAPMTSSTMGTPVSGERFEREVAGQVMSFRLPGAGLAEAQFQPDGTAVYSGRELDGIGRWRTWKDGYCAYYPWLGGGPALRPPFNGPVESDGYRCYAVRAEGGYYVLFRPDGTYVGTLVPVPG